MSNYTIRPISDRTAFTGKHQTSQFTVSYSTAVDILDRELGHLKARDVVVEVDVAESGIRLDGQLRADARASSPAIRVAFDSKHGPLTYATDVFVRPAWRRGGMLHDWQHNLYAIALGLEALRKVDRYGVVRRGEQYAGFKQLGAGRAMPSSHMTSDAALQILADAVTEAGPTTCYPADIRAGITSGLWPVHRNKVVRVAHPDRLDGDHTRWNQCRDAAETLGVKL